MKAMARKVYEGSKEDERKDAIGARRAGMTAKEWEKSPQDKKADRDGQAKIDRAVKKR